MRRERSRTDMHVLRRAIAPPGQDAKRGGKCVDTGATTRAIHGTESRAIRLHWLIGQLTSVGQQACSTSHIPTRPCQYTPRSARARACLCTADEIPLPNAVCECLCACVCSLNRVLFSATDAGLLESRGALPSAGPCANAGSVSLLCVCAHFCGAHFELQ